MQVLVGYASAHGSTAEIAHKIGDVLQQYDCDATVASVDTIHSITAYDCFVLGSAVHNSKLLPSMFAFIRRFKDDLALNPVFFWVTCVRVLEEGGRAHVMQHYIPYEVVPGMYVQDVAIFAGKLHYEGVRPEEKWLLATGYDGTQSLQDMAADYRDWQAINNWAETMARQISSRRDVSQPSPD